MPLLDRTLMVQDVMAHLRRQDAALARHAIATAIRGQIGLRHLNEPKLDGPGLLRATREGVREARVFLKALDAQLSEEIDRERLAGDAT